MESAIGPDSLPRPGTHLFYPALLAQIRTVAPNFPLDPITLRALLLCIIAGNRNLILRTREEDIGVLSKLATLTLATVFGHTVHRIKLHSDAKCHTPLELLRLLFLPSSILPPTNSGSLSPASAISKQRDKHRRTPTSSSRISTGKQSLAQGSITTVRSRKMSFPRSSSYPPEAKYASATGHPPQPVFAVSDLSSVLVDYFSPAAEHTVRPSPHAFGVRTEPSVPTISFGGHDYHQGLQLDSEYPKFPSAIVVSGLEFASLPAQRAVLRTLTEQKLTLEDDGPPEREPRTLPIPEDFMIVFICRSDDREKPAVCKGLLDRFAMSTPIAVQPAMRQAVRQHLPRPPSSPSTTLPSPNSPGSSPAHYFPSMTLPTSVPPTIPAAPFLPSPPLISPSLIKMLQTLNANTNIRPAIGLYLSDLFTATRHFHALDGSLLTARTRHDAESLVRASRVLGVDLTGAELIKDTAKSDLDTTEEGSTTEQGHNRVSFGSDRTPNGMVPSSIGEDDRSGASMSMVSGVGDDEPPELDVSEADIARIFPRVVSHRLRVRDSPMDEVLSSAVRGAVRRPVEKDSRTGEDEQRLWERDTIKDILVKILSEV
ncbi:hypothetical protein BJ138DRAFT_1081967 [Hygrophoropsis aurantiaca]|uniref:Uncharacterized protein n=1 Tax=Hygrophoropsis aurantiaca TaxID=72124 RepID=A0ACB8AJW4_9AGAM|nr:hypothetical protein BJ138DRAFT_1081967 [Hygrophoropsis aurantiaca]